MIIFRSNKSNVIDTLNEVIEKHCIINDDIIFFGPSLFFDNNSLNLLNEINKVLILKNNKLYFVKNQNDNDDFFSDEMNDTISSSNIRFLKQNEVINDYLILNSNLYLYDNRINVNNVISYGLPSVSLLALNYSFNKRSNDVNVKMTNTEMIELNKLYFNNEIKNWIFLLDDQSSFELNGTLFQSLTEESLIKI